MSYTINLSKAGAPGAASAPLGSPSKDHRHKGKQPRSAAAWVALLLLLAGGVYAVAVVSRMYSNPGPRRWRRRLCRVQRGPPTSCACMGS
mmetsp:Transcript_12837/g.33122  ORF Transcript_12837/g.33122 Transcript_12837/m.33122 type:complete len:90 (+) Transcript_12837:373-642(+)